MSTINIQHDETWPDDALKVCCPICGHDYAHHGDVMTFGRRGGREDGPTIARLNGVEIVSEVPNPSPRRDAVRIYFDGECGHAFWLDIVQHKGQTFIFQRFGLQAVA